MPPAKKAAAKAPAKTAPQPTVTLKHLAAALAEDHDLPKRQAEAMLGDLVALTTRHLKKGDKIRLNGIGIPHGSEPGDRRVDQDQSQQEGRLPGCQGTEGSGVDSRPLVAGSADSPIIGT
jgi:nucleoid DNA-binding protein